MKTLKFSLIGVFFLAAGVLVAPMARAVTLENALTDFLDRSPQLKGQQMQVDLSSGDRYRRFFIREPQLQITSTDDASALVYGLSLTTPFPGKSFAMMEQDRTKWAGDRAELQAKKHDLAKLVVQSYLDCASNKETVILQSQAVEDFGLLARSLRTLYESGHSTQAEKIGAEIQLRQTKADLDMAESRTHSLCQRWHDLIGSASEEAEPEGIPDDLSDEAVSRIGDETADQARSQAGLQTADTNRSLRWWNQMPDVTWSVARNHYLYAPASPAGKDWTTTYGLSLTIPILFPFEEANDAKRALLRKVRSTATWRNCSWIRPASIDLRLRVKERARSKRLSELRQSDIPLAEALVESTFAAYKSGKLGYSELMLSRKTLLDLRAQEIQTRVASLSARLRCLQACEIKKD